jgi:hypothetical protein
VTPRAALGFLTLCPSAAPRCPRSSFRARRGVALFHRALGGATGDTSGSLTKVVEGACYAVVVAMWT